VIDKSNMTLACDLYEMVGNQSGMVSVWITLLYSWIGKDDLEWIQNWTCMKKDYKGWREIYKHEKYYMIVW